MTMRVSESDSEGGHPSSGSMLKRISPPSPTKGRRKSDTRYLQRAAQVLEMIERFLCPPPRLVVLRVVHILRRGADLPFQRRRVEFGQRDSDLRQDCQAAWVYFRKTAAHENALMLCLSRRHVDRSRLQRRQDRRMARQHGEQALRSGHGHLLDLGREQQPLR